MLVQIGFKEIDISFPSASDTEFNFTRKLVEHPTMVPDDVWLQVLSPCKKEHIRRTVDSVRGARNIIISLYIATSDTFLKTVFGMSQDEVLQTAVDCVSYARSISKDHPDHAGTNWNLMFSPEAFSDTDPSFSARLCAAVQATWEPSVEVPMILNLPATVEMASPNVYADQVEMFCQSVTEPEKVVVSLHPHNDRGCAVAAAELGVMAGARRVEGCLFGNGERTGNVDLVTLALNLYSQGIDPHLDLSDLKSIKAVYEECTRIKVPIRLPYSGDAVFIAYSGSHQDAINKSFNKMKAAPDGSAQRRWKVPYLAIDPEDIGTTYESVIRLNSQSGKGGVAWTLGRELDLDLPKGLQLAFSKVVKAVSEKWARTLGPAEVADLFLQTYYAISKDPHIFKANCAAEGAVKRMSAIVYIGGEALMVEGQGTDVVAAVEDGLKRVELCNLKFELHQRMLITEGIAMRGIALVECVSSGKSSWGANISENPDERVLLACLAAALVRT
jgi:2-isopropylmalate synthase